MYLFSETHKNGNEYTEVSVFACDNCDSEVYETDRHYEMDNFHLCVDCIRKIFFKFYKTYDLPLLEETEGLLRYTTKAKGKRRILPREIRDKVFKRDNYMCVFCYCDDRSKLTVDHIFPFILGGTDKFENLQTLCKKCNSKKGAKVEYVL